MKLHQKAVIQYLHGTSTVLGTMCVGMSVEEVLSYVWVFCVRSLRNKRYISEHVTYILYIYMCVCVCVCVHVHKCDMKINTLVQSHNLELYIISSCAGDKIEKNEMGWACSTNG